MRDMNMNFHAPKMPSFETESSCANLPFCEQLEITTRDCFSGVHPARRCTQGDFAQIKLLTKMFKTLENLVK